MHLISKYLIWFYSKHLKKYLELWEKISTLLTDLVYKGLQICGFPPLRHCEPTVVSF